MTRRFTRVLRLKPAALERSETWLVLMQWERHREASPGVHPLGARRKAGPGTPGPSSWLRDQGQVPNCQHLGVSCALPSRRQLSLRETILGLEQKSPPDFINRRKAAGLTA